MQKIFLLLLLSLALLACDKIDDGVVDPNENAVFVEDVNAPTSITYMKDSNSFWTDITFSDIEPIEKVWFELSSYDDVISIANVNMINKDINNPNLFSGLINMKEEDPTGNYVIKYFINTKLQEQKKMVSHQMFYDNLKAVKFENYDAPDKFVYSEVNNKIITSISFSNSYHIQVVWFSLKSADGINIIADSVKMNVSNGSSFLIETYKDSVTLDSTNESGEYQIDYFIKTNVDEKIVVKSHLFQLGDDNVNSAPIISNPLFYYIDENPILRDTLKSNTEFILSIKASDENGLSDIDSVYTDFYSPNNPSAIRVILFDDGNDEHGDLIAGDGIFSLKNIFSASTTGERKFDFWARDNSGALSNVITHNVVVK